MKQQLTRRVLAVFLALGLGLTQLCACSQETDVPGAESGTDVTESAGTTADTADTGIADYTVLDNPGLTIYVDGSAASDGDGTEAAPYRTVTAANEHILELRASDALPEGGIRVLVQPGKYYIPEGLNFGTDGYGSEECPIVWESTEAQGAMLYAGAVIDTAAGTALNDDEKARIIDKDAAEKIVKIDLAAQGYTIDNWGVIYPWGRSAKPDLYPIENPQTAEFFCNSERMTLARYPNSEYLITGARAKAPDGLEGPTFLVHDDNEKSKEVVSHLEQYQTFDDVWVYGYFMHMWSDAGIPVVGTSTNFKKLTVAHEPHYGIGNEHKKYYFFNVFEEIDMPGEYYVDRDAGMLYYYPPQDAASAEIVMTDSAATLVSGGNVSYVTLRGFDLSYTKGN
ncbi:MAG: hypothetical protein IJ302_09950, partial [Clostridia bacterium]|nr:hypothetical protein [Clostridia bacterium]